MENSFSEVMSRKTNHELFEILRNRSTYQPLAIIAADAEFEKRGITEKEIQEIQEINEKILLEASEAGKLASFFEKTMLILYPVIAFLCMYLFYDKAVFDKKKVNLKNWFLGSLAARVGLIILFVIADFLSAI